MAKSTMGHVRVATRSARMMPAFVSARPPASRVVAASSPLLGRFFDMIPQRQDRRVGDLRCRDGVGLVPWTALLPEISGGEISLATNLLCSDCTPDPGRERQTHRTEEGLGPRRPQLTTTNQVERAPLLSPRRNNQTLTQLDSPRLGPSARQSHSEHIIAGSTPL
jgi:hypothetical protein